MVYLQEVILRDDPGVAELVARQRSALDWHLGLLRNSASDYVLGNEVRLMVEFIHVHKKATRISPAFRSGFEMNTLAEVPTSILIRLLAKTLRSCMAGVQSSVCGNMTELALNDTVTTLKDIPTTLAALCNVEYKSRPSDLKIELKLVVGDRMSGIIHLV